jgi:hypothetical protein
MRAPCDRDHVQGWIDQLVEAFMADDQESYTRAARWLTEYVNRVQASKGKIRAGNTWFKPESLEGIKRRTMLATIGRKRKARCKLRCG